MNNVPLYVVRVAYFFAIIFYTPLFARDMMPSLSRIHDKVEQARLTKKTTIQELLQTSANKSPDSMSDFFNQLDGLTWSNREVFIKTLLELQSNEPEKALIYLKDQLLMVFPQEKYPLVVFSHELKREYDVLQKSTTQLFSLINKKESHNGLSVQQGLEKITKLKNNLESILHFVNDLL